MDSKKIKVEIKEEMINKELDHTNVIELAKELLNLEELIEIVESSDQIDNISILETIKHNTEQIGVRLLQLIQECDIDINTPNYSVISKFQDKFAHIKIKKEEIKRILLEDSTYYIMEKEKISFSLDNDNMILIQYDLDSEGIPYNEGITKELNKELYDKVQTYFDVNLADFGVKICSSEQYIQI